MKQIILVAIFVVGCAHSSADVQVSEPKKLVEDPAVVAVGTLKESRWPDHFFVSVKTTTKDGADIDVPCQWDLEFKRDGASFRVSGGDSYPELGPITTFDEHTAAIKKLACLMPVFILDAETLELQDIEGLGCVAELRKILMDHHALVLPEEEVRPAAERDLNFMSRRTDNNVNLFWTNVIPVPHFDEFEEGQVIVVKGGEVRVLERSHVAGHECLWVNFDISDQGDRGEVNRFKTSYCYSSKLFLHLSTTLVGTVEESGVSREIHLTYLIEDIQIPK